MATDPRVGGRNDLNALKDARRCHNEAASNAKRAIDEVERMREGMGRPDYSRIHALLGKLSLDLSTGSRHLEEMWTLRALNRQTAENEELAARVADLEAKLTQVLESIGVRQ